MFARMDTSQEVPESVTDLLAALADPQRQRVLRAFLATRCWELAASEIADRCLPLSRPAVSHHLAVMRRSSVLTARREGKNIYYAINRGYITSSLQTFVEFLESCCPEPHAARAATASRQVAHNA